MLKRNSSGCVASLVVLVLLGGARPGTTQDLASSELPSVRLAAEEAARREAVNGGTGTAEEGTISQAPAARRDAAAVVPKPRLAGSATGYVDNAFIGPQLRFRFDAGVGLNTPDRAEFFYAKCGCYRLAGIDPDAGGPVPALPAGADPAVTPLIENDLDYRDYQFYAELAPSTRFSVFFDGAVRSLSPAIIDSATGIGDIKAGVKLGLVAEDTRALTFQFRSYFPSGDSEKGLGTAHPSLEFSLLYNDLVAERVSFAGEFGTWVPIDGANAVPVSNDDDFSGNVLRWGFGLGVDLVNQPSFGFAPVVEVVGWHLLGGYQSVTPDGTPGLLTIPSAEGLDIVNLKLGGRFTFNGRHSLYAGYGFPMSDTHWYDDIVRVEYRYAF